MASALSTGPTGCRSAKATESLSDSFNFAERPVQGLGVKAEKCQVEVAHTSAKSIALWTDTAPEDVVLRIGKAKRGARVGMFNQWRDEKHGSTMYHLNNAAMEVAQQSDGTVLLRCSDGWGEPDFENLVVILSHHPA